LSTAPPQIADRSEPFRSRIREGRAGPDRGAGGLGGGDECAWAVDARHRGGVCRRGWPQPVEPHRGEPRLPSACGRNTRASSVVTCRSLRSPIFLSTALAERLHLGQPREAVLAAWGIRPTAKRRSYTWRRGPRRTTASCREVFPGYAPSLLCPDPLLVASDGAPGIIRAIEECLPRSVRQRCLAHKMRNLQKQGARRRLAGVQGPQYSLLPGAPSPALARLLARRHRGDL